MWKNNVKIAWRTMLNNKVFSLVNIGGLAVGLAVSLLILLFVLHELSYDRFHERENDIYRMRASFQFGDQTFNTIAMSAGVGPVVEAQIPEVEQYVRMSTRQDANIASDQDHIYAESGFLLADPSILEVFSFPLIEGDPSNALAQPQSVVITEAAAKKYFGDQHPIGKTLTYEGKIPFTITGIVSEPPSNSTLQFDFIASLSSHNAIERLENPEMEEEKLSLNYQDIGLGSFATYFLLQPGTDPKVIPNKIAELNQPRAGATSDRKDSYFIEPLRDLHLKSSFSNSADARPVYLFLGIAFLILSLAIINYISLSTARSVQRAKEVGVRKVIGATRSKLVQQFYTESALVTLVSFGLGIWLVTVLQPVFYQMLGLSIDRSFLIHPLILSVYSGLLILCIGLSGSVPAFLLSAFKPVKVLRGQMVSGKKGNRVRQGLIIFQFTATLVLLIGSIIVGQQLRYLSLQTAAYDADQIISVPFSSDVQGTLSAYKSRIEATTDVTGISTTSAQLFKSGVSTYFVNSPITEKEVPLNLMSVDKHFLDLFQLQWQAPPRDPQRLGAPNTLVLNETAITELGIQVEDTNRPIRLGNTDYEYIGTLKDFKYQTLKWPVRPLAVFVAESDSAFAKRGGAFYLKFPAGTDMATQIGALSRVHREFEPQQPFEYYFLDETLAAFYKAETRTGAMLKAFTGFAILISSLGLFGLITHSTERRTKEIGIRKVLGASLQEIVGLLSKDFLLLVIIALIIASPVAWYFMDQWLESFAFRIQIQWWVFILAGLAAMLIAFLTVAVQSVRAALANPVQALRNE